MIHVRCVCDVAFLTCLALINIRSPCILLKVDNYSSYVGEGLGGGGHPPDDVDDEDGGW